MGCPKQGQFADLLEIVSVLLLPSCCTGCDFMCAETTSPTYREGRKHRPALPTRRHRSHLEKRNDYPWRVAPPSRRSRSVPDPSLIGRKVSFRRNKVSFGSVEVREFHRTAGDHPWNDCSEGSPLNIDWELDPVPVELYEGNRRHSDVSAMSSTPRKESLKFGFHVPDEEIEAAEKGATKAAKKRRKTRRQLHLAKQTRRIFSRATAPFSYRRLRSSD